MTNQKDTLKLGNKMKVIPINHYSKLWVLCACPECEGEFIAKLEQTDDTNPNNLFGLKPLPEDLTCPYCGIKNDVCANAFVEITL